MKAKKYLDELISEGRSFFTRQELEGALGLSKGSIGVTLTRLKREGMIASPVRGYYIIIPPQYRSLGSLPPDHFIPDLMKFLKKPYYVGLLSAGMYYGAAHQQPQVFQVMVPDILRDIVIGKVRVKFYMNKYLRQCPMRKFNTPMSELLVSTPEATALDLVGYPRASGGLSNIFTVLSELVESMNVADFNQVVHLKWETSVLQRLGYLFELLGEEKYAAGIEECLKDRRYDKVLLEPRNSSKKGGVSGRWKLIINQHIESDL